MKLLFISNYFPPISGPGAIRPYYFVKHIHNKLEKVTVLCAENDNTYGKDESFETSWDNVEFKRFPGNNFTSFQQLLFRLKLYPLLNIFFPKTFFERQSTWANNAEKFLNHHLKTEEYDGIYVTTGPFCAALMAHRVRKKFGIPFVVDFRDSFSGSPARIWMSYWHWKYFTKLEGRVIKEASATIVVANGLKDELLKKHPATKPESILVIKNGFEQKEKVAIDLPALKKGAINIMYAGSLIDYDGGPVKFAPNKFAIPYRRVNYNMGTRSLYYTLKGLAKSRLQESVSIRIFGKHHLPVTNSIIEQAGLHNSIQFKGKVPFSEIHKNMQAADFLLLPMEERIDGERSFFLTGKLFEYIHSGKPILAIGAENEATELLTQLNYPFLRAENDIDAVADLLKRLVNRDFSFSGELNSQKLKECTREEQANLLLKTLQQKFKAV